MGASPCVCTAVLLACWVTNLIHSLPLETTVNCTAGTSVDLGEIDDGYTGDIEIFPSMPDDELQLVPADCPQCLQFLELISSGTNITVRTKQELDTEALRETEGVISYQISCTATGVANGRRLIVEDVNDNPPIFEKEEYRATVSEVLPLGAVVVQVKATDADLSPANNHINYAIQPPTNTFEVNEFGQILLKERLNYTVSSQHNFIVKAQDPGGLFDETTVVISIIDKLSPQFQYDHYEASVPENQVGPVTEVLPAPIKASTSEESNNTVIYSISKVSPANYGDSFTVDQNTGVITVVTELDLEEMNDNITLLVKASLEIDSTRTANTSVTLFVKDVNDNPPVFEKEEYRATVSETLPVGVVVVQVKATDADLSPANNHINYTIQPPSNTFEANGLGQILLKERLNYTITRQHNFIVKAQDPGGLFDETTVVISIIDKLTPQFQYDHYEASVPENQVGPVTDVLPAPIKASTSEESNNTVIYSISKVSPANYGDSFTVDQNTGVITVVTELDLEEMNDNITLLVKASLEIDSTRTANTSVTLFVKDVNDNPPVFEKEEYRATVSETLPVGAVVLQLIAADADLSLANNIFNYTIKPPSNTFEVNGLGQILLKERLNYTVSSQHNFSVKAQDLGGLFGETRVIISIIDKLILQFEHDLYEASIPEHQVGPVFEVLPAPIKASVNVESSYAIIYSLSEVSPSNYQNNFMVDQFTGIITVVTELDFENIKDTITIIVQASLKIDTTVTTNTSVTFHVENVNEPPVFNVKLYTAEIFDVVSPKVPVVDVKATDPDVGESEKLQYSLVEPSSAFAVEPSSGQVYVVSVAGVSGKVTLKVKATDPHGLYDTTTVEVTIKESASEDVVVISLNQGIDTVLNQSMKLEEALERALGWSVSIISVSSSRKQLDQSRTTEIFPLQREDTPRTFVSFIASEANGTDVIPKETVQNKLHDDKEIVLEEMQKIFGPSVNFDIVHDSKVPDITTEIILGTVISLICIGIGIGLFMYKKISPDGLKGKGSMGKRPDLDRDRHSMGERPDLDRDRHSMGERPDLDRDRDSMGERPDLDRDKDSMGGRPDLG